MPGNCAAAKIGAISSVNAAVTWTVIDSSNVYFRIRPPSVKEAAPAWPD
jgi:hypothetical protein